MHSPPEIRIAMDANAFFNDLWKLPSHATHNPSPTPVTLRRADLAAWKPPFHHVVAEKTDGERATILFGRTDDFKETPYTVLIRRNREMLLLPTTDTDPGLYDGTLLDGEWIDSHFRAFDVVSVRGYNKKKKPFADRMAAVAEVLPHFTPVGWTADAKPFHELSYLPALDRDIRAGKRGKCDGLVFMPKLDPVTTGRAENIKKWKPTMKNTIDLHHAQGTWSCTGRSGQLEPYPVTMNGGTDREGIFELRPLANGAWEICGHREDKKHPNHITTVEKTLATIEEDIGMADLLSAMQ